MSGFAQAKLAGRPLPSTQWSSVMPLTGSSPWLSDARRAISRVARLGDGWDGQGGPAIQQRAISAATRLLDEIEAYSELPVPSVGPIVGGGLGINWRYGARDLDLEFLPDGTIEYLQSERKDSGFDAEAMQDGVIPHGNLRDTRKLLVWLIQGC